MESWGIVVFMGHSSGGKIHVAVVFILLLKVFEVHELEAPRKYRKTSKV